MAWFTNSASAPKVVVGDRDLINRFWAPASSYSQTYEVTEYELRGVTKAAADSYAATQAAAGNNPQIFPIGAGGYNVRTTEQTVGSWTEDT